MLKRNSIFGGSKIFLTPRKLSSKERSQIGLVKPTVKMSVLGNYVPQRLRPLFSKFKSRVGFKSLIALKSDKTDKPQGGDASKENYGHPFPDLPPLSGLSDENFTKYLWRTLANPLVLRHSAENFAEECKNYYEMRREEFRNEFIIRDPTNHVDMLFTFNNAKDVEKFSVTSDSTNNTGYSTASLVLTQDKTALFSGYLNTEPIKTGNVVLAGFANMLSPRKRVGFRIKGCYDWSNYTHLVFKVRGDGRSYLIVLPVPQTYDEIQGHMYAHPLYTRGGPYWQIAKIPFSHFFFMNQGRMTDNQNNPIALTQIGNLGITAAGFDGQFKLEIDYIGLEFDPYHNKASPYEEYVGNY